MGATSEHYPVCAGGSGPVPCWPARRPRDRRRGRGPNPSGGASDRRCAEPSSRNRIRACVVPSVLRTASTLGSSPRRPASSVTIAKSTTFTACTRRLTHLTALRTSISSGRSSAATFSRLAPSVCLVSTVAATRSTSSSEPESRLARQSGSRLNVVLPVGQYHRATRIPDGNFRVYVPCPEKPQPPRGCSGHRARVAFSQPCWLTYSSLVSAHSWRNCTGRARTGPTVAGHFPSVRSRGRATYPSTREHHLSSPIRKIRLLALANGRGRDCVSRVQA